VQARLRAMIEPGGANAFDLQQCIVWVNFIQEGLRLCGVLASLYNGIIIVVPITDDGIYLWDEVQHVHGDIERVKKEDGVTDSKFSNDVLETAIRALQLD
jgi:hypothetical protein